MEPALQCSMGGSESPGDEHERGGVATTNGEREPATEAAGDRSEPGRGDTDGSDSEKTAVACRFEKYVAFVSAEFGQSERAACKLCHP